jgi:hypothetical protein
MFIYKYTSLHTDKTKAPSTSLPEWYHVVVGNVSISDTLVEIPGNLILNSLLHIYVYKIYASYFYCGSLSLIAPPSPLCPPPPLCPSPPLHPPPPFLLFPSRSCHYRWISSVHLLQWFRYGRSPSNATKEKQIRN